MIGWLSGRQLTSGIALPGRYVEKLVSLLSFVSLPSLLPTCYKHSTPMGSGLFGCASCYKRSVLLGLGLCNSSFVLMFVRQVINNRYSTLQNRTSKTPHHPPLHNLLPTYPHRQHRAFVLPAVGDKITQTVIDSLCFVGLIFKKLDNFHTPLPHISALDTNHLPKLGRISR